MEAGEDLETALRRELIEEAGAKVESLSYLGSLEHFWPDKSAINHELNHFFRAECPTLNTSSTPKCVDEGVELSRIPITSIETSRIKPAVIRKFILRTLQGQIEPWWAFVNEESKLNISSSSMHLG